MAHGSLQSWVALVAQDVGSCTIVVVLLLVENFNLYSHLNRQTKYGVFTFVVYAHTRPLYEHVNGPLICYPVYTP